MTFTPVNIIDATDDGDSVRVGIEKIDANVTDAYDHLNTLNATVVGKINRSDRNVPNGVCPLDSDLLVPLANIPTLPISQFEVDPRIPIGSVIMWPMDTLPAGCLHCDGSELSEAYTELITVLVANGSPYGTGSSSRPKIPDYRGYFIRAYEGAASIDPNGATLGRTQLDTMESHYHSINFSRSYAASGGAISAIVSISTSGEVTSSTYSSVVGTENRPINKSVKMLIKYE